MPPASDPFQHEVARIALAVASRHGFALAGGQALIAHGIGARPTEDVDLFTDVDGGVTAAAELVHAALLDAGFQVETIADPTELDDVFYGFEHDMTEFEVHRGGQAVRLQLVRFARSNSPILLEVGPVLHLDDVIGTKVAAMVTRAQPRDYIDVAAFLDRYSTDDLVALARQADPALTDEEFHEALQRLDGLPDAVFALYRLTPSQIRAIRGTFAAWPRSPMP